MNLLRRVILSLALIAGIFPALAQVPPPVPALPDTERRTTYSISGSACSCSVGFALYGDSTDFGNWLEVFINGVLISSSNYTITSPTGPVATISRPITDAVLTFTAPQTGTVQIVGARRPRRTSQFQESQPVPTRNFNVVFSDIIAMLREDWDKINDVTGRAVLAAPGETLALLPAKATRASQGACFDSNGNFVNCVSIPSSTFSAGNNITFTGTNPTTISVTIPPTFTLNNLINLTLQDASSSQDALTSGANSSTACDPGYDNTGGVSPGPCGQINFAPNSTASSFQTLLLRATNSRAILAAVGGAANPEVVCADTNAFGVPGWLGTNTAGCGVVISARTGSGSPAFFNVNDNGSPGSTLTASIAPGTGGRGLLTVTSQGGTPLVLNETLVGTTTPLTARTVVVGSASTNPTFCSPNCTGTGGTGTYAVNNSQTVASETMFGGPSGAEGSVQMQIQGGSLDGLTQQMLAFLNASNCAVWALSPCGGTPAGSRLGEVAGFGMSGDGLFTQTETVSINFYSDVAFTGTHLDGSYTAPSNIVFSAAHGSNTPQAILGGFYNPGAFALGAFAANGNNFQCGAGCLHLKNGGAVSTFTTGAGTIYVDANGYLHYMQNVAGFNGGTGLNGDIGVLSGTFTTGHHICASPTANGTVLVDCGS